MTMDDPDKIEALKGLTMMLMEPRPFHNFRHAVEVTSRYRAIGKVEGLSEYEMFVGTTAALGHDIVCRPYYNANEEESALMMRKVLPALGYTKREVRDVERLILATKLPVHPETLCEKVICDADVDNLGSDAFFERNRALAIEYGVKNRYGWMYQSLRFLEGHRYHTHTSMVTRGEGILHNIGMMKEITKSF